MTFNKTYTAAPPGATLEERIEGHGISGIDFAGTLDITFDGMRDLITNYQIGRASCRERV